MLNEAGANVQAIIAAVGIIAIIVLFFAFTISNYRKTFGSSKLRAGKTRKQARRKTKEASSEGVSGETNKESSTALDALIEEELPPINLVEVNNEIDEVIKITGIAEPVDSMVIIDDVLKNELRDATLKIARKLSIMNPRIIIKEMSEVEKTDTGHDKVASVLVNEGKEAIFGTPDFNYQTIRISAYPGYNAYPDKLIYVIAHELCHKILHSLDRGRPHNEKDERETDIAAVLLGFGNSYISAKNVDNGLGYLSMDEALFLKGKSSRILKRIKSERDNAYRKFVELRRANNDKFMFLDSLCRAKSLITDDDWEIDYTTTGDDYNKLLVCTKSISVSELNEYRKLCEHFKKMKESVDRYSLSSIEPSDKMGRLREIVDSLILPSFEYSSLLKKYS
ncbi:MAG: hypothetical protein MR705_13055 [Flintibacter sp.]|uniref:hypothetical protein n=1 Tax=Flintibacter sp. TaxID=1918624 RepID=UPI0026718ABE|nr:hypothetical protein [Flintibacter sp.]MCI6151341.1 hypothetical protein [Flintibacter sp.]MCI7303444.1 hypothetical protein [Clostridia bacterium]MDY5037418.1 hypothetical protein [Lawsonibacter sp.]